MFSDRRRQAFPFEKQVWSYNAPFSSLDSDLLVVYRVFKGFQSFNDPVPSTAGKNSDFVLSLVESVFFAQLPNPL
jgi:hypothetical protein